MIDLDALEEPDAAFELYCRLGCLLLTLRLTYVEWRVIVLAWGMHKYIIPDERVVIDRLLDIGWLRSKRSSTMLIQYGLRIRDIGCHYTETHQIRMAEILEKKSPENSLASVL